ncbi:ScyD/ScyE family protein [Nocardioidaceae bacterium SCSIO 66511]|nr:ScyD/ScyE family protein [Nocardioidaceae bacterium SCSIO 66511]
MNTKVLYTRVIPCALGVVALAVPTVTATGADQAPPHSLKAAKHKVIADKLDNPRQLSLTPNGNLLVAQAGHGSYDPADCVGEGDEAQCVGSSGKVTVVKKGKKWSPMRHLLSAAGPDGTFAVGSDGASKRPGGPYYAIMTYAPPDLIPEGVPGKQAGKLMARRAGGKMHIVADIAKYEKNHDPDGEGFDSNPYSVLALRKHVLVADAAGDTIYRVRKGKIRVFHKMKEYGKKVDAVPTSLAVDRRTGNILVGELHSEIPGKAKVWSLSKKGKVVRTWKGFTTVTGVARTKNGTLYVSELFGGKCGFDQIPTCFPGRVVRVAPNGKRRTYAVPFPAGVAVKNGKPYVAAFSIAPATGAMGNPAWNGQIWRLR